MGLRFLEGAAASTGSAMVVGTIADMWSKLRDSLVIYYPHDSL